MLDRVGVEFGRSGTFVGIAIALCVAFSAGILVGRFVGSGDIAGERRALDTRAFELVTRALAPGSALACLDASATEMMEGACEKALFGTPEATAAAVSYVAHQIALLAVSRENVRRTGVAYGTALAQLRRNAETDRFGVVAHVLSVQHGCTAERCDALAMLSDASRVRGNLAARAFDANVRRYAVAWALTPNNSRSHAAAPPAAASPQPPSVASTPPAAPPPVASVRTPNNYFLPSASSIPAVSIMNPEPTGPELDPASAATDAKPPASRKPPARTPAHTSTAAGSNATRAPVSAPMPIAPSAQ